MKLTKISSAIALSFTLAACGGSSSSTKTDDNTGGTVDPVVNYKNIEGQLVVPLTLEVSARDTVSNIKTRAITAEQCENVPSGYMPLSSASVVLHNALNETVNEAIMTDECGEFTFVVDETLVSELQKIIATKEGYKNVVSDIDNFIADNAAKIVSTIESDAEYEISGFQKSGDQSVNFIITDSKSKKAVIGLPSTAFKFTLGGSEISNTSIVGSQNTSQNFASVAVTLDASGSMDTYVKDENSDYLLAPDGKYHTRYTLVAAAAHDLVDMTKINDPDSELALTLFSSYIYPMTDAVIADNLSLYDAADSEINFSINSVSGFVKDQATLHTLIDLYNPTSEMYNPSSYSTNTERHPDRVDSIASASYYPFSGSTAFYDSIDSAIDQLVSANVSKPMIVALTDGSDNRSSQSVDDVILKAKQHNIAVSIIGAGDGLSTSDVEAMQKITDETGSAYFDVTNIAELGGFLAGISTRVTFNYDAELNTPLVSGETLNLSLTVNEEVVVARDLLIL